MTVRGALLAACLSLPLLASCGDKPLEFVMAELNPHDSVAAQVDQKFCDEVLLLSKGTVRISLHAGAALGDESDFLKDMIGNEGSKISFARISPGSLLPYGCKKNALLLSPFMFDDRLHFWRFAESPVAREFLMEPLEAGLGIRGLFYGEEGFRHFFSTRPIEGPGDFAGTPLRISGDLVMKGLAEELGARAVPTPLVELFVKLKTGEVEAAEQPVANYVSNGFYAVAPNLLLDGHAIGAIEVVCAERAWRQLSRGQKKAVEQAAALARVYCRELSLRMESELLQRLASEGVAVRRPEDKAAWREACKSTIGACSLSEPEAYKKIIGFRNRRNQAGD